MTISLLMMNLLLVSTIIVAVLLKLMIFLDGYDDDENLVDNTRDIASTSGFYNLKPDDHNNKKCK